MELRVLYELKRVLAQENNVWLAVQFYAWRRIWGEFTSDERAVNGSSSGRAGPKGDQKSFNLLVVRYQHKVASLVSRYVPQGDVPDVVQESFIKAYRALESFRGDSAFIPGCIESP